MKPQTSDLERIAAELRAQVIGLSHRAKTPHLGSSLSCIDLLVALYWEFLRIDPAKPDAADRDRFILSKGHAAPALYVISAAEASSTTVCSMNTEKTAPRSLSNPRRAAPPGSSGRRDRSDTGFPLASAWPWPAASADSTTARSSC